MYDFFDGQDNLIKISSRFTGYLSFCVGCGFIWVPQYNLKVLTEKGKGISKENWELLQKCIIDLNIWGPTPEELKKVNLNIRPDSCFLCAREAYKRLIPKIQTKSGAVPCFGTAVNGHCSEDGADGRQPCKYCCMCVTTQDRLDLWQQRKNPQKIAMRA